MRIYILGAIFITSLFISSCNDNKKSSETESNSWTPALSKNQHLIRIVTLSPGEVLPVNGVINSSGTYGIIVKEAWELHDRSKADSASYWVYLRSVSSEQYNPNSIGTSNGAATSFDHEDGMEYEVANETPLNITVAIYSQNK